MAVITTRSDGLYRTCADEQRLQAVAVIQVAWGELRRSRNGRMLKKEMTPAIFLLLCLDILMDTEADFIKEIRYLSGLMHQNCHDASWRMERLLSKVEQGESLDTRSTSIQLREAREELQLLMRGIEGIQKLCEELESDDS
jgi:hypothetical protein